MYPESRQLGFARELLKLSRHRVFRTHILRAGDIIMHCHATSYNLNHVTRALLMPRCHKINFPSGTGKSKFQLFILGLHGSPLNLWASSTYHFNLASYPRFRSSKENIDAWNFQSFLPPFLSLPPFFVGLSGSRSRRSL